MVWAPQTTRGRLNLMRGVTLRSNFAQYFLPLWVCLIDFAYTTNTVDPLNPIKFWLIGILALYLLSSFLSTKGTIGFLKSKTPLRFAVLFSGLFSGALIFAFLVTDVKSVGLIGYFGRNNGILSYLFLILIFLYLSVNYIEEFLKSFYLIIGFITLVFSVYGAFQHFNYDFVKWNAPYNKITLTLGNPDFSAALLGIFVAILFAYLFSEVSNFLKMAIAGLISFTTLVIYWTNARQGLMAVALGIGIVLTSVIWKKNRRLAVGFISAEIIVAILSVLGMLQKGPLSKYLYKTSINDRGYDWRAGWHMFTSRPWTGVGVDRYAGYFLKYRDSKYPLIYGYQQSVNNSHNLFVEFFATGGLFLGIAYILLIIFIGWRGLKALQAAEGVNRMLVTGILSGWLIFVAQSAISVDNLGISVWGWTLGGILVGCSLNSMDTQNRERFVNSRLKKYCAFLFLIFLFSMVIIPMYNGQTRMSTFQRIAVPNSTSVTQKTLYSQIADKTFTTPLLSPDDKVLIAFSVTNAGLVNQGTSYFEQILKIDPRRSDAAQFLGTIFESQKDYKQAVYYRNLARSLDPWGTPNLLQLVNDYLAIGDKNSAIEVSKAINVMAPGTENAKRALQAIAR
jgi:O-antigen ligase